jgi:hypothetical protein
VDENGGTCGTGGGKEKFIQKFSLKSQAKRTLWISRRYQKDNIKNGS